MEEMQPITQVAIMVERAVFNVIIKAADLTAGSTGRNTVDNAGHKAGRPQLKQPTFNMYSICIQLIIKRQIH